MLNLKTYITLSDNVMCENETVVHFNHSLVSVLISAKSMQAVMSVKYCKRGSFCGVEIFTVFMGTQITSKIYLGLQNFWCSYILAA